MIDVVKQLVGVGAPPVERRLAWWIENFRFRTSRAARRLQTGEITIRQFREWGHQELKDTLYGIAETGAGRRLTRKEIYQVRRTLKEQIGYWDRFCEAVVSQRKALAERGLKGDELEEAYNKLYAKFDRRAQSYHGAVEAEGAAWAMGQNEGRWYQWTLRPAEHCIDCVEREGEIHQVKDGRLPYMPKDGSTQCLYNCLCFWKPIAKPPSGKRKLGPMGARWRGRKLAEKPVAKHYGPGPHPGTGTPQSIHAGARQRKGTPRAKGKLGQFPAIQDAERWGEENYPNINWDFEGAHIDTINPTLKQFDKLAKQYPEVAKRLEYVGTYKGEEAPAGHSFAKSDAWAHASNDGKRIGLNPDWYGDPKKFKKALDRSQDLRWSAKKGGGFRVVGRWHPQGCNTFEMPITHEFGHQVQNWLEYHGSVAFLPHIGTDGFGLVGGTAWLFTQYNKPTRKGTSIYATTNRFEGFAEGFTALYHSPKKSWSVYVKRQKKLLDMVSNTSKWSKPNKYEYAIDLPYDDPKRKQALDELAKLKKGLKIG